ncbi:helix-turn-helix domain-containing protein [Escherichia coli]
MNTDTFMCSSDEKQTRSPLSLYSEYQRMEIEFRAPHIMPTSHWHGQVEVNVPFDGDVEYLINNVAEHVKLNANYAMGIFQRVMQLTMKQYITAMRINHVRALLSDTDKSILDIALTAGFRSSSRFYSTFGKYVGMSPQQYRKLSQQRRQTFPG